MKKNPVSRLAFSSVLVGAFGYFLLGPVIIALTGGLMSMSSPNDSESKFPILVIYAPLLILSLTLGYADYSKAKRNQSSATSSKVALVFNGILAAIVLLLAFS